MPHLEKGANEDRNVKGSDTTRAGLLWASKSPSVTGGQLRGPSQPPECPRRVSGPVSPAPTSRGPLCPTLPPSLAGMPRCTHQTLGPAGKQGTPPGGGRGCGGCRPGLRAACGSRCTASRPPPARNRDLTGPATWEEAFPIPCLAQGQGGWSPHRVTSGCSFPVSRSGMGEWAPFFPGASPL